MLEKGPLPEVLRVNQLAWTQAYVAASKEERPAREKWRHSEIKVALRAETDSKCAYCEAKIVDVSYPHVEHIRPKVDFPELAHEWTNLTTACSVCNTQKGDYFVEDAELLNPYVDEVQNSIEHFGPIIDWVAGDIRAEITVRKLDLNRPALVVSRGDRLASIRELYNKWHESSEPLRTTLASAIRLDASRGEFRQTVFAYLRARDFPL